jgi:WD40 repeat protein
LLSVAAVLEGLPDPSAACRPADAPYRGLWAATARRVERAVLEGHTDWVRALCQVEAGGQALLAFAGDDGTVRLWDPATGQQHRVLEGRTGGVRALCQVDVGGRALLASAGHDRAVRLWDPGAGNVVLTIPVHHDATSCVTIGDCLIVGLRAGILAIRINPGRCV